jgi:hypothetical protein
LRVPFPIKRGVKSFEEEPRGASEWESMPFPGRTASAGGTLEGARRMDILMKEDEVTGTSKNCN